jgi:hypothetical protein
MIFLPHSKDGRVDLQIIRGLSIQILFARSLIFLCQCHAAPRVSLRVGRLTCQTRVESKGK